MSSVPRPMGNRIGTVVEHNPFTRTPQIVAPPIRGALRRIPSTLDYASSGRRSSKYDRVGYVVATFTYGLELRGQTPS
jgi:hypothetical protein